MKKNIPTVLAVIAALAITGIALGRYLLRCINPDARRRTDEAAERGLGV